MANLTKPSPSSAMRSAWIDRLFDRLAAMYGARFADMWRGASMATVKATWAEDLGDYTVEEIKQGIEACKRKEWPPTLPEFLTMCRPPVNYEAAFLEAVEQMRLRETGADKWPSKALFWAAAALGGDLSRFPYPALQSRWKAALDAKLRDSGLPEVPPRMDALPAPGGITTKAVARDALEQIRALTKRMTAPIC